MATVQCAGPFKIEGKPLTLGPVLQVATHPLGPDAIEVLWEINAYLTPDASESRTHLAVFADNLRLLKGMKVNVLASLDGERFTSIGSVEGPGNRFVHKPVIPGCLYYYKLTATTADGKAWGESGTVMGAAGENLVAHPGFETLRVGMMGKDSDKPAEMDLDEGAFHVKRGHRPYGRGDKILAFDPAGVSGRQISIKDRPIALAEKAAYLQGGWIRAPGNVWYGRWFVNPERDGDDDYWSYVIPSLGRTPEWVFAVQRIEEDDDWDTHNHRPDGRPHGRGTQDWTYSPFASHMRPFTTAFGPGELDDLWIIQVTNAPPGATLSP